MSFTITTIVYLDMLQQFFTRQLDKDGQEGHIHFQQDGTPPHYLREVHKYFNPCFPGRWIGRVAPIAWLPHPADFTFLDIFLWGFLKDQVFVPPLPANAVEFRPQIIAAVAEVTPKMLHSVWQEIDYRWDVYCFTSGSHIEPELYQAKFGVFCYIMTVQNTVYVL
jgi:hypothetical protein